MATQMITHGLHTDHRKQEPGMDCFVINKGHNIISDHTIMNKLLSKIITTIVVLFSQALQLN